MEGFCREVAARLPLAQAVMRLFRWICEEEFLAEVFRQHRGRSYEKLLTFPQMVQLVCDALLQHHGSGRQSFARAKEEGEIDCGIHSVYRKLADLPLSLSMGFFHETTKRLQQVFPQEVNYCPVPPSLGEFEILCHDGKTIKHVQKRLKVLQGISGSLLGGRLVVSQSYRTGMAVALSASEDGESGETRLLPEALRQTREVIARTRLHVCDRGYCGSPQMNACQEHGDHFLLRFHKQRLAFHENADWEPAEGMDRYGRSYTEDWGWLGGPDHPERRPVRRIQLHRPGIKDELILLTDLEDPDQYPADDLLEAYLKRWNIERMFQQVTEVFSLESLIGSSPKATVFQASFCFLLYNLIQVLRAYIAEGQEIESVETISSELLFVDVHRQLNGWTELLDVSQTVDQLPPLMGVSDVIDHLRELLGTQWTDRWWKSPSNTHRSAKVKAKKPVRGGHAAVFRILQAQKVRRKT